MNRPAAEDTHPDTVAQRKEEAMDNKTLFRMGLKEIEEVYRIKDCLFKYSLVSPLPLARSCKRMASRGQQ